MRISQVLMASDSLRYVEDIQGLDYNQSSLWKSSFAHGVYNSLIIGLIFIL